MKGKLTKIDFLMVRESQYEVLHHFTRKLYEAGLRKGLNCRLLAGEEMITVPLKDPPQLTVGFNGAPRNANKEMFCDHLGIPHLSILVDPPYRFLYLATSPHPIVTCDDRVGCEMLQQLDFQRTFFLPHGVEPELAPNPAEEKVFDVVMMATFVPFKEMRNQWKSKFHPLICKLMDETVEITLSDPNLSFMTAFDTLFAEARQKNPAQVFENVALSKVLEEIEMYLKGRDKFALVTAIKDVPVTIFGAGFQGISWNDYLGKEHPNIFPHGPISFEQALKIFQQTKVLLNPNVKNKQGAHERVFAGFACGAAVITNASAYLKETFTENRDILFYNARDVSDVNDKVTALLKDEQKRAALASLGREIVQAHHTWDHRIDKILEEVPRFLK